LGVLHRINFPQVIWPYSDRSTEHDMALGIDLNRRSTQMLNKKLGLALVAVVATAVAVKSAKAFTGNGTATATIVTPLTFTSSQNLQFGTIDAATGGTVTVSPAGVRSKTGALALISSGAGAEGHLDVTGTGTLTYAITLPANGTVTIANGANNMAVDSFLSNPAGTGALVAGAQTINVGGTLTVASGQAAGLYSGTYPVSVDYN
jgi:hypothetical protein